MSRSSSQGSTISQFWDLKVVNLFFIHWEPISCSPTNVFEHKQLLLRQLRLYVFKPKPGF